MLVTLLGIVTEVKPRQNSKAEPEISVTVLGISNEVTFLPAGNWWRMVLFYGFVFVVEYPIYCAIIGVNSRYLYNGQIDAITESSRSYRLDTGRNNDRFQTGATLESLLSNAGDAIGNRYRSQTGAVIESITGNFGNGIGQVNRREVFASGKRVITDSGVLAS